VPTWTVALLVAAVLVLVAVPALAGRAFAIGWFERRDQTRRSRRHRRPTHGGLLVAVVLLVAGVLADVDGDLTRAAAAVAVLAVLAGHRAERGRGPVWLVPAGWGAVALAVPLCGVRAELTGTPALDVVLTAIGVLALIAGLDAVDHSDGVAPLVAGVAATGLLAVAVDAHDPVAVLAAAVVGACVGVAGHSWPPAAVRLGAIGPMALGGALGIVGVAVRPSVPAPRSAVVPLLGLGLVALCSLGPGLDRRLVGRRLPAHLVLPLAVGAGAFAAGALASGDLGLGPAVALAVVPAALVVWAGRARRSAEGANPRRLRPVVVVPLALVAVALVAAAGVLALSARRSMERGRDAALAGLDEARAGHVEAAQARFAAARAEFAAARSRLANPLVHVGDVLPVVAPNLRSARTLAAVGSDLSSTAVAVARKADADELRVVDGRFPVEQSRSIGEALGQARTTMERALRRLDDARSPYLVGPLADARDQVRDQLADVRSSVDVAAEATRLLPSLLGAERDQRWIVAVMSTSELRGAGGLLGDFAELRLADGKVDLVRTFSAHDINTASHPDRQRAVLPPVYAQEYSGYDPSVFWQNLSATPNVVTMSRAIAAAYPTTDGGGPVDGVLTIDPLGLRGLLDLTGPVRVSGWPTPISAADVTDVLLFQQYAQLDAAHLEHFQGEVVAAVVRALTTGRLASPPALARALAPAVAGGHLRLWSADPDGQHLIARIGADGALDAPSRRDFVQLVTQNLSEAKVDWYLQRSLAYDATFDPPSGHLTATATVTLTNHAPASGVASYLIGERGGPTDPGQNRMLVTVLTPHRVMGATSGGGASLPLNLGREDGLYSASVLVVIPPGGTEVVHFALEGDVPPGTDYQLEVGHQPTRVPDHVDVAVQGSGGWRVARGGGGASTDRDGPERLSFPFAPR
jgi:UDP-N-acetylmuramyl pentapeptide phosphotransferase/UDP-N-acetylglucosamine-1-phosphate transferase